MWAILLHLGSNMWGKPGECHHYVQEQSIIYHDKLYCDMDIWHKVTEFLPQCGINTVLIDVGEAIRLDSHPEMAVEGSLTKSEMKKELDRLRSLGLTPIPKLNFSTTHNGWLGKYNLRSSILWRTFAMLTKKKRRILKMKSSISYTRCKI